MTILLFILILVALILVHELGHFTVAKLFGIRVDEFGIFFPPRITALKFGETEYSINWLPMGGFVKIFGENYDEGKDNPRSFIRKPRLMQAAVIVAGIASNLAFAWLVLSVGYMSGLPTSAQHKGYGTVTNEVPTVVMVLPNSPAERVGLMPGDVVEKIQTAQDSIDTRTLNTSMQSAVVTNFITSHQDESIVITVVRDGKEMNFLARAAEGIVEGRKAVGIELDDIGILRLPPHLALLEGGTFAWEITRSTAMGLGGFFKQIVSGRANFSQVAGPIGITVFGAAAIKQGFAAVVVLTALISINLALINLLPIPGLDGGRLLIIIIEGVIRRPVSVRLVNSLTLAGMALLFALMILVSYHDIARLVG